MSDKYMTVCCDFLQPQISPNLEYTSHLPKMFIMYCCPQYPPLGATIIKESAFWLTTHIYFVAHIHAVTELGWISWYRQRPFLSLFFRKFGICHKHTFSSSSQAISPICAKLCTQHLWTRLTKSYWKNFDILNSDIIFQTRLKSLSCRKLLNKNFLYILLKTQSIAYHHIGQSQWDETQVITSP